jgi:hypothetical protein
LAAHLAEDIHPLCSDRYHGILKMCLQTKTPLTYKQGQETIGKSPGAYRKEYVQVVGGFIEDTFIEEKGKYETIEGKLEQNRR